MDMLKFNVLEKFLSIDGEGPTAGELAAFIRFGGCNLACNWCDTVYSIDSENIGELLSKEEIYRFIKSTGAVNVTLTGGEPMLQFGFEELLQFISQDPELMIHIETNGSIPVYEYEEILQKEKISFVVDYKLPGSGMEQYMHLQNFSRLRSVDVCKFVVASQQDLERAAQIIESFRLMDQCRIYISPIRECIDPIMVVEFMKQHGWNKVKLQLQLHKIIWPAETRCV